MRSLCCNEYKSGNRMTSYFTLLSAKLKLSTNPSSAMPTNRCCGCFSKSKPPPNAYGNNQEIRGHTPEFHKKIWSMEIRYPPIVWMKKQSETWR